MGILGILVGFVVGVFVALGVQGGIKWFQKRAKQAQDAVEDGRDIIRKWKN